MLHALANNPSQLQHPRTLPRTFQQNMTAGEHPSLPEGFTGLAGAILVFEEVIKVCPRHVPVNG